MSDVRSDAAMAGICDTQRLIHDVSKAFSEASSVRDLDDKWRNLVTPVYSQIDEDDMGIISRLYGLSATVLMQRTVD